MTKRKSKSRQIDLAVLSFYSLLTEFWVGLYPDSISTSSGPIAREHLSELVHKAYARLLEDENQHKKRRFHEIKRDFDRVGRLVEMYRSAQPEDQEEILAKEEHERAYLAKRTVSALREIT